MALKSHLAIVKFEEAEEQELEVSATGKELGGFESFKKSFIEKFSGKIARKLQAASSL